MRTSIIYTLLVLLVVGCSKQEKDTVDTVENPVGSSSTESGTVIKLSKIEDRLKNEARNLKAGTGSEENFVNMFNEYLSATDDKNLVDDNALPLQKELIRIFDDRLNLYLNLLNSSLEGKQAQTLKIDFKNDDPESAKMALQQLYTALSSRKLRSKLSLADQYLVFDLTIILKNKFSVLNQETVPETKIGDFLKSMISDNIKTPQEAFYAYQIAHNLLQSDYALFTAFHPIIAKVKIHGKSTANEIELYKRLSGFALNEKLVSFLNSKEDTVNFFNNINFIAKNSIEKINSLGVDQKVPFFQNLDLAFNIHTAYLGKAAEKNNMDIQELSKIQDSFSESTHLALIKSLNVKPSTYLVLFKNECINFQSRELDLILRSFLLSTDTKNETNCVSFLKEKIQKKDYTYLEDLKKNIGDENAKFSIVNNTDIKNYFEQYTNVVLNNWILNIVAKNVNHEELRETNQERLYNIYQNSKLALMNVLKLRELNDVNVLEKSIPKDGMSILKAGIYSGNINTKQTIYLHPLAIIIPDRDSALEITSEAIVGGRIDANFIRKDYSQVLNANLNQNVFKGAVPIQNAAISELVDQIEHRDRYCKKDCSENTWTSYKYRISRSGIEGKPPGQAFVGEKGINAKSVSLILSKRNILETTIFSFGEKGFRGNQGLNSPRCNQANEYQIFRAKFYSFLCEATSGGSNNCPQKSAENENSPASLKELVSLAGKSGDGGEGGNGGRIVIKGNSKIMYPGLSLGGIGGEPGVRASCIYPSQSNELDGAKGKLGQNGRVEFI